MAVGWENPSAEPKSWIRARALFMCVAAAVSHFALHVQHSPIVIMTSFQALAQLEA